MQRKITNLATVTFLFFIILFQYCSAPPALEEKNTNQPPNIVLIFADDMGYGDLSCYGQQKYATPNLDQMARDGVKFTNFYVAQPVCSASRISLLTGCYANRVGFAGALMPRDSSGIHSDETTIAEMLKANGYATAIYGKWHLGHLPPFLPTRHGFDEYFGIPYSNDMWPNHPNNQNFNFPELPLMENEKVVRYLTENQDSLTTWYTQHAVDFIQRKKDSPFFLYVAHSMPHVPLYVSDQFRDKSGAGLYGDVIMEIDWSVGEIIKALKANHLDENTLIIFTSDNGPWLSYGTHAGETAGLREGKGTVFEGGIRVPCIAKWPRKLPDNFVQPQTASTIDLFPTIASWTNSTLPDLKIDGSNIAHLFLNTPPDSAHTKPYFFYYHRNQLQAMLSEDGRWKLYFPHTFNSFVEKTGRSDGLPTPYTPTPIALELYDLQNDPFETVNVIDKFPEIAHTLQSQADTMRLFLGDDLREISGSENRPRGVFSR